MSGTPQAPLEATRLRRLGATAIDAVITVLMVVFVTLASGVFEVPGPYLNDTTMLWAAALVVLSYVVLHGWTLLRSSQTLGKKLLGLQVVEQHSFARASILRLALRASCVWLLIFVPVIGMWLQLTHALDAAVLLLDKRQALHDRVAQTRVIDLTSINNLTTEPKTGTTS